MNTPEAENELTRDDLDRLTELIFDDIDRAEAENERLREALARAEAENERLRDALRERTVSAHDAHRVASRGVLHPTSTIDDCPSMACGGLLRLLTPHPADQEGR